MRLVFAAMMTVVGLTLGCGTSGNSSSPLGTVAIIDLDQIAEEVGAGQQIAQRIAERESDLGDQIKQAMETFNTQIATKKDDLGKESTPEEKQVLAEMQQQAGQKLTLAKQRAAQDLQQFRAQQLVEFRERVRPVARAVANEKGLSIIITKTDTVYDVLEAVDITAEVATRLGRDESADTATASTSTPAKQR